MAKKMTPGGGEHSTFNLLPFDLKSETGSADLDLFHPETVSHVIDSDSPLFDMTPAKLKRADFEVIVYVEGTDYSTGMTTQLRTSYLSDEVLWGHRFAPLLYQHRLSASKIPCHLANNMKLITCIDFSNFDQVVKDEAAYIK